MSKFKCGGSPSKNIRKEEHNTSFKVELADREGNKWISSNRSPHDSIPVKLNPETAEEWGIERSTSNALWSFYILSDHRKKMYFTMLLQPELGLLLRAENAYDRYLGKNNEVLEMVKTDTPTYDMHWLIASSFEMINAVIEPFNVQIHQKLSILKWMSERAQINTQIQAKQLISDQEWTLSIGDNHTSGFQVEVLKRMMLYNFQKLGHRS
ncbi:uncharacterized protein LOC144424560 isoform X4 [Styela clava]